MAKQAHQPKRAANSGENLTSAHAPAKVASRAERTPDQMAAMVAALRPKILAIHVVTIGERTLRDIVEDRLVDEGEAVPSHGLLHVLHGRSWTGKSRLMASVANLAAFAQRPGVLAVACPALLVVAPLGADGDDLAAEMLRSLAKKLDAPGMYVAHNGDENLRRLLLLLQRHEVRWIFLDQFERATNRPKRSKGLGAFDLINFLSKDHSINVVLAGDSRCLGRTDADAPFGPVPSRQEVAALPLVPDDDLKDFVARFQAQLPKTMADSGLTTSDKMPDILIRLHIASEGGVQGALLDLLNRAAMIAIRGNKQRISARHLAEAHCARTGEPVDEHNLFLLKDIKAYRSLAVRRSAANAPPLSPRSNKAN